jgi:hypothetical protein
MPRIERSFHFSGNLCRNANTPTIVATQDQRKVLTDPNATYFGAALDDQTLVPGANPRLGSIRYDDWLSRGLVKG